MFKRPNTLAANKIIHWFISLKSTKIWWTEGWCQLPKWKLPCPVFRSEPLFIPRGHQMKRKSFTLKEGLKYCCISHLFLKWTSSNLLVNCRWQGEKVGGKVCDSDIFKSCWIESETIRYQKFRVVFIYLYLWSRGILRPLSRDFWFNKRSLTVQWIEGPTYGHFLGAESIFRMDM